MRKSGILLHISSLPSDYGIGKWEAQPMHLQIFWWMPVYRYGRSCPSRPPSYGDSPYQSFPSMPETPTYRL